MTSTLILSAGMTRSGSTWLYNAIRIVLSHDPTIKDDLAFGWVGDWNDLPERKHTLIKVHEFDGQLVDRAKFIFYSYRDIRDSIASSFRKFGTEPSVKLADHYIRMYEQWTSVANMVVPYEDIVSKKQEIICNLGKMLGVTSFNASAIQHQINNMCYEGDGNKNDVYNYVNLFHKGHITDGGHGTWANFIDSDLVKQIEVFHREWFERCGYSVFE